MYKASDLFTLTGRIQHIQPTKPASAKSLADERDRIRGLCSIDGRHNDLNKQFQNLVVEGKRTKWHSSVDKCDHLAGISHLWRHAKGLSSKKLHNAPNKVVRFADKAYLDTRWLRINSLINLLHHQYIRTVISKKTAQTAFPSAVINTNADFPTCRKKSDPEASDNTG